MKTETTDEKMILTIADLKEAAASKLPRVAREYYNEGAMDMITLRDNEAAFDTFKIRPRILTNVANVDTSTSIFGKNVSMPVGFAPAAMHGLAHPDGEKATSRAAINLGLAMGLSTYATTSMEEVIQQPGSETIPYGFQLSILKNRATSLEWIRRAEASGYKALIITVDAPVLGHRLNERRNKLEIHEPLSLPNLKGEEYTDKDGVTRMRPVRTFYNPGRDASNTWESAIEWTKSQTNLEIWLKGIYTPEDVMLAIKHKIDGVIVSNHGGRQLDGVPATIHALAECAPVAKGKIKIAIDGGIRRGTDVFKALALGADFCFIGRVPIWGLAYDGQKGVELAFEIIAAELRTAMALAGCPTVADISRKHLSVLGANGLLARL